MLEKILNSYSYETLKIINELLDSGHNEIISIIRWQYDGTSLKKILNCFEQGYDDVVNIFGKDRFDYFQVEEILLGLKNKIDVSIYSYSKFDGEQMRKIRLGLEKSTDVSVHVNSKFDDKQKAEIRYGLNIGIDVSLYADPKFDCDQMEQIRLGLESGIDVSIYADVKFDWEQMEEIRLGLELNADVSTYADPKFDDEQMYEIRRNLEYKLGYYDLSSADIERESNKRYRKLLSTNIDSSSNKNMIVDDIILKIKEIMAKELIKSGKLESILILLETKNDIEIEILNSLIRTEKIKMNDVVKEVLATNNAKYIYLFAKNIDYAPYELLIDALIRIQNFEYIYKALADVVFVDRDYSNDINFYTALGSSRLDLRQMKYKLWDSIKKQEEKMSGFQRYLEFNYQPLLRAMNNCKDYSLLEKMLKKYPPCSKLICNEIRKLVKDGNKTRKLVKDKKKNN